MTFTSLGFAAFFPLVVFLYNILPKKFRLYFLLLASCIFYAFIQPIYLLLLALVTTLTYCFARLIGVASEEKKRHRLFVIGIISVLLPLLLFKYYNSLSDAFVSLFAAIGFEMSTCHISWLLPVGISYYTFMSIGYLIDVYNEEVEVENNMATVGLFLSFFPIILSGPIERAGNMFPQFKKLDRSKYDDLVSGLKMMLWGYFMKFCVADRLGLYIDTVYGNISEYSGSSFAFAAALYPFQVYGDLGGYSLIAIGVARCLGFNIVPNFNRPFFATSMSEFWRRWHMSLINWLTDYIYTPLSFALRNWKVFGIICALLLTFLISGIWHAATTVIIVWGLIQGAYLSIETIFHKKRTLMENKYNLPTKWWYILVCCIIVFILFAFSQIFGRCTSLEDASAIIKKIFTDRGDFYFNLFNCSMGIFCLAILLLKDFRDEFFPNKMKMFNNQSIVVRWLSYFACVALILLFGAFEGTSFIYFKF